MLHVNARATDGPGQPFHPMVIERRQLRPTDVLIDIAYTGICHSDVHHALSERGTSTYPLVPGHEIAGVVSRVGSAVTRFAVGDRAGVGCMIGSCADCDDCRAGHEQYCDGDHVLTYNSVDHDGRPNHGGYSEKIVVDERFALHIPDRIALDKAAPLLCAGITVYSPLRHWNAGPGKRVAIVGLGGLGHLGVQISHGLGAHTTVLERSPDRAEDARRFGAQDYRLTTDPDTFKQLTGTLDLIISTVPASFELDGFLDMLRTDGTLVNLGVAEKPLSLPPKALLRNRRSISGSLIGGIAETQEMLDFCAENGIHAEVEVVGAEDIDDAFARVLSGDVQYRFVIDIATLGSV